MIDQVGRAAKLSAGARRKATLAMAAAKILLPREGEGGKHESHSPQLNVPSGGEWV